MKNAHAHESKRLILYLFAALLGLALTTFIAANREISVLEQGLLQSIYDLPGPLAESMYVVTQAGSAGAVLAVVGATFVLKRKKLAALLLANALVAYVVTAVIKEVIARPRPAELFSEIVVRLEYASGFGFPSGHTAVATALALTLWPYTTKKYRWLLVAWIVGVAVSRLYLGVHAPLDVIGGFCVGLAVVTGMQLASLKLARSKST